MNTHTPNVGSGTTNRSSDVRHTRDDALTDLKFERLYNASFDFSPVQDLEARFVLMTGGRLGMRRGEIPHMQSDWVDWRKRRINIPRYLDCDLGRDNRACGGCRQHAKQMVKHNDGMTFEEAIGGMWQPKTDAAVRSVPFAFSPRSEIVLEAYFDRFDRWMYSGQAINRRVNWLAEGAGLDTNVYPHALRATAATFLADRNMDPFSLQAFFGWANLSTAVNYIQQSAERTARELHRING